MRSIRRTFFYIAFLLLAPGAWADEPCQPVDRTQEEKLRKQALEILGKYRNAQEVFGRAEFARFVKESSFHAIDSDKDGALDLEEFTTAALYCWVDNEKVHQCSADAAWDRFIEDADGAGAEELFLRSQPWQNRIQRRIIARWTRAGRCAKDVSNLSVDDLVMHLYNESQLAAFPPTAEQRLAAIRTIEPAGASYAQIKKWHLTEQFATADSDLSGALDLQEYQIIYKGRALLLDFVAIDGESESPDFLLDKEEFLDAKNRGEGELDEGQEALTTAFLSDTTGETTGPWSVGTLAAAFGKEDKEREESLRKKRDVKIFGRSYVADRGLVLLGDSTYDKEAERFAIDWSRQAFTLRLMKDFAVTGSKANPAVFGWSKNSGALGSWTVDAAVRFDWYHPKFYYQDGITALPAFGVEVERSGADSKKVEKYDFLVLADVFVMHGLAWWSSSRLLLAPVYQIDAANGVDAVNGRIEWEPGLNLGRFSTGVWEGIGKEQNFRWYVTPLLALDFYHVTDKPVGHAAKDRSFLRFGLRVGTSFWKRGEITYELTQRDRADNFNKDFTYHQLIGTLRLDREGLLSLNATYKYGQDAPSFQRVENYMIGLGVKF